MPKTNLSVLFGRNALAMRADLTVTVNAGGTQSFTSASDLSNENSQRKYITFEPNYWVLDGSYKFVPETTTNGYMSTGQSGATGVFTTAPQLQFDFGGLYSTNGLTLHFSEATGDWCDDITVAFYDTSQTTPLIRTDNYTPTDATFSTGQAVADFDRIIITFSGTNNAYRFARLVNIDFDTLTRWTDSNIKSGKLHESINLLSIELPSNEIEFTLYSSDGNFSITDPLGDYAALQENEPLDAYEQVGDVDLYLGRFYLDTWESISETDARFTAMDAIKLMDKIQYLHPFDYYDDWTTYGPLIARIFSEAGLDYEIDGTITTTGTHNLLFNIYTCREMLQMVLFQLGAYATCTRSNVVRILPFELASDLTITNCDYNLTAAEIATGAKVELQKPVTSVTVSAYTNLDYHLDSDRVVFNQTMATGDHTILLENYALSYFGGTATYTVTDSGANWVKINVTVSGTFTVTETYNYNRTEIPTVLENGTLPADTPKNDISVDVKTLYFDPTVVDVVTQRVYDYYLQRFTKKIKLYGSTAQVGNSVLANTQSSKQIKGIIERSTTNLTGGFITDIEVTGVIA